MTLVGLGYFTLVAVS